MIKPKASLLVTFVILLVLFAGHAYAAKTVADATGRTVQIPDRPMRIISLAPNITEIIYDLKQQHRLVGATRYSNYPEAAKKLTRVGSYVRLDLEKILALRPDLCIAVKDGTPIVIVNRLVELGIPVYAVDPRSITAVMKTGQALGVVLAVPDVANRILSNMQTRLDHIKEKVAKSRFRPRVFFQIGLSPIFSVGPNTLADEMITLGGGRNVVQGKTQYPVYSREQVLELAPEVYIISTMTQENVFEDIKQRWQPWQQIPAVRNQRMYLINSDLTSRPSPRALYGLECVAAAIHPELFDLTGMNCR